MSLVQTLSNTTVHFCIGVQVGLEGVNRAMCHPEILGTDMDVGFGFFHTDTEEATLLPCQGRNPHRGPEAYEEEMDLKVMLKVWD